MPTINMFLKSWISFCVLLLHAVEANRLYLLFPSCAAAAAAAAVCGVYMHAAACSRWATASLLFVHACWHAHNSTRRKYSSEQLPLKACCLLQPHQLAAAVTQESLSLSSLFVSSCSCCSCNCCCCCCCCCCCHGSSSSSEMKAGCILKRQRKQHANANPRTPLIDQR